MRLLASFLIAALALAPVGAHARPASPRASAPSAASAASGSAEAPSPRLIEQGHYRNVDGVVVRAPAHTVGGTAPAGATAQCRDASWSFSLHHRGTCSHHGGVARWL